MNFMSNNFRKPCILLVKVGPSKTTPPVCIGCGRSVSGTVRSERESESTKRSKQNQKVTVTFLQNRAKSENFYKLFGKAVRELVVQRDIRYFLAFDSSTILNTILV